MTGVWVQPAGAEPDPTVGELLAAWLPGRRWFPGSGSVHAEPWLAVTFDDAGPGPGPWASAPGADVVVLLVRLTGAGLPGGTAVVQVPLVLSSAAERGPGFIAVVTTGSGDVAVHDGAAHPAFWLALLHTMGLDDAADDALVAGGRVLAGEQSNTSVVLPGVPSPAGTGGMLKILRTVVPGPHPDVVVPQALTRAGFAGVPRFLGALEVETPVVGASTTDGARWPGGPTALAVLAELVPGARDGFELACELAGRDESFAPRAAELGGVVAELHTVLRQALPPGPRLVPHDFVEALRRRAATAVAEAPALAARSAAITALLDDLERRLPALRLQAIHGDLHLGQALYGPSGWKVLDFEGEPQRPAAERTAPDLPARDVAGMLRSFGYAAAVGGASAPVGWYSEAGQAFLDAYRERADAPEADPPTAEVVLRALVLDKALYEVVYETRQRPDWVHIPLTGVDQALNLL
ncbi:phosphotransferase [Isoptericola sp. NEAU-Y5]|uniref:Phosphotransferase n=1 Tax=Isoptericola luteus TaxID=2879484 RepID=A0ABS7ZJK1_9MICO|nr:phosphotransferase [Isoptericola sp. NEAU-Y5]MCA5895195.1 phosphotransferase [Isoptericola sp. NEAU-Y5]